MAATTTKVLVVDDHALLSDAVAIALSTGGRDVRALSVPAAKAPDLLAEALALHADIAVLEPDPDSPGRVRELIRPLARSGVDVIVVSGTTDPAEWGCCLRRGARVVLTRDHCLQDLIAVVERLAAGRTVLDVEAFTRLTALERDRVDEDEELRRRLARLTPREAEVLGHLMSGHPIPEIAATDAVSVETVRTQVRSILHKLQVSSQIAAVATAYRVRWRPAEPVTAAAHGWN